MDLIVGNNNCSFVEVLNLLQGTLSFTEKSIEVARKLNVPQDVVYKVKTGLARETISHYDAFHEILESWRSKESINAKLSVLIGVLELCHDIRAAENLSTHFDVPQDRHITNNAEIGVHKFIKSLHFMFALLLGSVLVMYLMNITDQDAIRWSQLDNSTKEELLEKRVNVSGKSVVLRDVLTFAGLGTPLDDGLLDAKILLDLKDDKQPNILENSVPQPISYYVPRRMSSRRLLKTEEIFNKAPNDVFVFTGIASRPELSLYASGQSTDTSSNQRRMKSITVKYMVLDMNSDFDDLSKKVDRPIHWIEHDHGKFYWVKSLGDLHTIQTAIESKHEQREYHQDEFNEIAKGMSDLPVVISDTPGMGKTLLLANLGRELVSREEIVLFGAMSKVVSALKCKMDGDTLTLNAVIHVLSSLGGKQGTVANAYLMKAFKSDEIGINVMLDGFDEVISDDRDIASRHGNGL